MSKSICIIGSILFTVMSLSCTHPSDADLPLYAPGLSTPVVTGLQITSAASAEVLAIWGSPSEPPPYAGTTNLGHGGGIPTQYRFDTPYPNPSNGNIVIAFSLPTQSTVSLWIVHARWFQSADPDYAPYADGVTPAPNNGAIKTLLHNSPMLAGSYRIVWDTRDDRGSLASPGFYRVYFRANDFISWCDVLFFQSWADLPADLRNLMTNH